MARFRTFDEALRLKPSDTDALVNRGNARKIKGDLDGALQDYDEAIRLNPDDSEAFYNRGNARKAKGDQVARSRATTRPFASSPTIPTRWSIKATREKQKAT